MDEEYRVKSYNKILVGLNILLFILLFTEIMNQPECKGCMLRQYEGQVEVYGNCTAISNIINPSLIQYEPPQALATTGLAATPCPKCKDCPTTKCPKCPDCTCPKPCDCITEEMKDELLNMKYPQGSACYQGGYSKGKAVCLDILGLKKIGVTAPKPYYQYENQGEDLICFEDKGGYFTYNNTIWEATKNKTLTKVSKQ